ncbi:MAG: VWA domain-containing protein [Candidatus Diapherotrites archaeon]|uniref:VWA domain-containing protein n=1 Tax=Candidatus Iainarchaeum sp. TaxID=3101447 RepID=A0A8T3YJ57_9ARCH|nr:VWA domain-containing protein [Candidatus Diapherotrites archaeon]
MDLKLAAIGVLLLALLQFSHASQLTGNCSITSTQCQLSMAEYTACNDTQASQSYSTYFNSDRAEWFNTVPDSFSLEAGQCTSLRAYAVANCYADPGQYTAQLVLKGSQGETTTSLCSLNLTQGHFVNVIMPRKSQEATQCEEKTYDILLTNSTIVPNQNSERIDLAVTGLPESWYSIEQRQLVVQKGQPVNVKLKVRAPCDAGFGSYDFKVRASLPNPAFFYEENGRYTIGQGQDTAFTPQGEMHEGAYAACLETPGEATIALSNRGKLSDNFLLKIEGPGFVSLGTDRLSLDAGKQAMVKVKFAPTSEKAGAYKFKLKATSTVFDYSVEREFAVKLGDCYNLRVDKTQGEESLCTEEKQAYTFSVYNDQTKAIDATASITGIGASLDNAKLRIEPGERKSVTATLDVKGLAKEAKATQSELAVELLIDTSGSMEEKIGGQQKMDIAKKAAVNLVNSISSVDFGMRVFGQGSECEASRQLSPVARLDIPAITARVLDFRPSGKTPMAEALSAAGKADFNAAQGKAKAIILVSDGKETCGGDTAQAAKELQQAGIKAYSVGFDIDLQGRKELQEIANRTGGKYFDAKDADALSGVLREISRELDILPGKAGARTFTLKVESEHFSYEKDYTVSVLDCYNTAMSAPELNMCPGVPKTDTLRIANLGAKQQQYTLKYAPAWVSGPTSVSVNAGEEKTVQLTATAPDNAARKYSVTAETPSQGISQEKAINYLSASSCYGTDIILPEPELDAATCQGKKQALTIRNSGAAAQEITVTADKPYVTIVGGKVKLAPGEKRDIDYFVSPPFDLPSTTLIGFTATTDRGFRAVAQLKLVVKGNEQSYSREKTDIRVADINATGAAGTSYDASVQFSLYNDSNKTLDIFSASILDYNGTVQLEKMTVEPHGTVKGRALIDMPADANAGMATVPLSFATDQGTYTRSITFSYGAKAGETKAESAVSIGTGLFNLANASTAILGILIVIVIGLIAYSAYRSANGDDNAHPKSGGETSPAHEAGKAAQAVTQENRTQAAAQAKGMGQQPAAESAAKQDKAAKHVTGSKWKARGKKGY